MKLSNIIASIILLLMLITPISLHAEEDLPPTDPPEGEVTEEPTDEEPIEEELIVPEEEPIVLEEEKSEATVWFEEKIMPFIVTALGGFAGTGVLTALLSFFVNKLKNGSKKAIEEATKALKLSAEESDRLVKLTEEKLEEVKKSLEAAVNSKIDEAVNQMNIASGDILASRDKQQQIANSIIEVLAKLEGASDEDNN